MLNVKIGASVSLSYGSQLLEFRIFNDDKLSWVVDIVHVRAFMWFKFLILEENEKEVTVFHHHFGFIIWQYNSGKDKT